MENKRFYHVSTDEVFGSLGEEGFFTEETAYDPRSSLFRFQSQFRPFCKSILSYTISWPGGIEQLFQQLLALITSRKS